MRTAAVTSVTLHKIVCTSLVAKCKQPRPNTTANAEVKNILIGFGFPMLSSSQMAIKRR